MRWYSFPRHGRPPRPKAKVDVAFANRTTQAQLTWVLDQLKCYTPYCEPFLHKVSRKEVPDYYDIIKNPMDLGTMTKRLQNGVYTGDRALFEQDLFRIYANCCEFNYAPGNEYARLANLMQAKSRKLLNGLPDAEGFHRADATVKHEKGSNAKPADQQCKAPDRAGAAVHPCDDDPQSQEWNRVTKRRRLGIMISRKREESTDFRQRPAMERRPMEMKRFVQGLQSKNCSCSHCEPTSSQKDDSQSFFPELENVMAAVPPCHGPAETARKMTNARNARTLLGLTAVGTSRSNPLLRNLELLSRIRATRKFAWRIASNNGNSTNDAIPTELKAAWDFRPECLPVTVSKKLHRPQTTSRDMVMCAESLMTVMRRSAALLLAHVGFEDVHANAMNTVVDLMERYCLNFGKTLRHIRDESDPRQPIESSLVTTVQEMTYGGFDALKRYWKLDVVDFGRQLKAIDNSLSKKYADKLNSAPTHVDIADDDIALLSGNFGGPLSDLGLDILGLNEAGLSAAEGVPDQLLRGENMPNIDFDRPYDLQSMKNKRAPKLRNLVVKPTGKIKGAAPRRRYKPPKPWARVTSSEGQIGLLQPLIRRMLQNAANGAAPEDLPTRHSTTKAPTKRKRASQSANS